MKKIFGLLTLMLLIVGCVETMALLGPASSVIGGGNVAQSTLSSAVNYGVKKTTGKSPMQHALSYADEKNPNKEKKRCISFIAKTNSEACAIAQKQATLTKDKIKKKTKKFFKKSSGKKDVIKKNIIKEILSPRGQAFANARQEKKKDFIYNGKIYNTRFKDTDKEKKIKLHNVLFAKKKNFTTNEKSVMELALEVQAALDQKFKVKD